MSRFYFNIYDGVASLDEDGTELPSQGAARTEAVKLAAGMAKDDAEELAGEWRVEVTDDIGLALFTVHVLTTYSPIGLQRLSPV